MALIGTRTDVAQKLTRLPLDKTLTQKRSAKAGQSAASAAVPPAVLADRDLVDRCRAGEVAAWEQLYRQCHPPLLIAIKVFLGRHGAGDDLAEEIAARVWYTLINDRGALLDRFDHRRGCRLTTFLAALAKKDVLRYLRSERRRQLREVSSRGQAASRGELPQPVEMDFDVALDEFLATLTLREREFCQDHLLANTADSLEKYTCSNRWQLQHRVRRKLWVFLNAS
ncbi:MAG: hypothetical protein WD403_14215 [Pirellulales bacterium]